jgi:hypothetical protein
MLIKGKDLSYRQETLVKAAFIYRWTYENPMRCRVYRCSLCNVAEPYENMGSSNGHTHPTIPLQHDNDWIAEHAFHFVKDGSRLMHNRHFAEPVYMADD